MGERVEEGDEGRKTIFPGAPIETAYLDSKFRPLVIRALRHYQRMLRDLASIDEVKEKTDFLLDPFGYYLIQRANEVRTITQELTEKRGLMDEEIKDEKYKATVQESLAYFAAELKDKRKKLEEGLGEENKEVIKGLLSKFNEEIGREIIRVNKLMDKDFKTGS